MIYSPFRCGHAESWKNVTTLNPHEPKSHCSSVRAQSETSCRTLTESAVACSSDGGSAAVTESVRKARRGAAKRSGAPRRGQSPGGWRPVEGQAGLPRRFGRAAEMSRCAARPQLTADTKPLRSGPSSLP